MIQKSKQQGHFACSLKEGNRSELDEIEAHGYGIRFRLTIAFTYFCMGSVTKQFCNWQGPSRSKRHMNLNLATWMLTIVNLKKWTSYSFRETVMKNSALAKIWQYLDTRTKISTMALKNLDYLWNIWASIYLIMLHGVTSSELLWKREVQTIYINKEMHKN